MLNANSKKDRLDYGELLKPPTNYELAQAITTTYSLHFKAALSAMLGLQSHLVKNKLLDQDLTVLDALMALNDRLLIFCQKGKIKVGMPNRFIPFLENIITEIPAPRKSSFHPKVWLLKYQDKQENQKALYRVIVLSRNLTFDKSWDVAICAEGFKTEQQQLKNQPLIDFVKYLFEQPSQLSNDKRTAFKKLFTEELAFVQFKDIERFYDYNFEPIGIQNHSNQIQHHTFEKLLVVSPFIDDYTMSILLKNTSQQLWVISRLDQLQRLSLDNIKTHSANKNLNVMLYTLHKDLVSGVLENHELEDDEEAKESKADKNHQDDKKGQDIHAKLFVGQNDNKISWWLGSANSTKPAFDQRNIEFMFHLKTVNTELNPINILDSIGGKNKNDEFEFIEAFKFENMTLTVEEGLPAAVLQELEYKIASLVFKGNCKEQKGTYTIDLTVDNPLKGSIIPENYASNIRLEIELYQKGSPSKKLLNEPTVYTFSKLKLENLNNYLIVKIFYNDSKKPIKQILHTMDIELPDFESRINKIIELVFESQERFLNYLRSVLTGYELPSEPVSGTTDDLPSEYVSEQNIQYWFANAAIYEDLLRAAAYDRRKIETINAIVKRLKGKRDKQEQLIVNEQFMRFWEHFQNFSS